MNLCDDNHQEVVYECGTCPVCAKDDEVDRLEREIESLRDKIRELEEKE